jgi:hypothetical protein
MICTIISKKEILEMYRNGTPIKRIISMFMSGNKLYTEPEAKKYVEEIIKQN